MIVANDSGAVFQETDVIHQIRPSSSAVTYAEFPMDETHGIALWPKHRLLADSRGTLQPVPHYCIAYCSNRAASVTRVIDQEGCVDSVELLPRHFGVVPADRSSSWKLTGAPDIQLIYLRRSMVDRVAEEHFGLEKSRVELLPKLGFSDGLLEPLALALHAAARNDDTCPSDGIYADHLVRLITMHLLRSHSTRAVAATVAGGLETVGDASHARMNHARDLIESALGEDLALERLAAEAGIAPHAFAAAFTKAVACRHTAM